MSYRLGPHQRLPAPRFLGLARQVLETVGMPEEEAARFADLWVEADCRGVHSHGLMRLPVYVARIGSSGTCGRRIARRASSGSTSPAGLNMRMPRRLSGWVSRWRRLC